MEPLKKITKGLLFPHPAVMVPLIPASAIFLIYAMVVLGTQSPVSYASYVLAAYTLTVWCMRIPRLIAFWKRFKTENRFAKRWFTDERLRMNVSLYGSLAWNVAYAVFQLWLGVYHATFWFSSLAGYYIFLAIMRFYLVRHTRHYHPGENMGVELIKYRACGWIFLGMNLALTLIVFFMVYWNRTFLHHEITTIAMAAYTFSAFTVAIVNIVKYRKYNSPVYSASKAINLAAACVSMLTLESTMLTTFGGQSMDLFSKRLFLALSGGAVSAFIIVMAIYMIVQGTKKIKILKEDIHSNGKTI